MKKTKSQTIKEINTVVSCLIKYIEKTDINYSDSTELKGGKKIENIK